MGERLAGGVANKMNAVPGGPKIMYGEGFTVPATMYSTAWVCSGFVAIFGSNHSSLVDLFKNVFKVLSIQQ
jgi:hypothetical protein